MLFDDVNWCLEVINTMLSRRGLNTLKTILEYHAVFCFPIIDYYHNVGFDFEKEPFDDLAVEYIDMYHANDSGNCKLFHDTKNVLAEIQSMGISQVILSASHIKNLNMQISSFGITDYFDEMLGLSDIYAKSKIDIGKDYIMREKISNAVLIGDSKHDYEVAQALNIDCILIKNGHLK